MRAAELLLEISTQMKSSPWARASSTAARAKAVAITLSPEILVHKYSHLGRMLDRHQSQVADNSSLEGGHKVGARAQAGEPRLPPNGIAWRKSQRISLQGEGVIHLLKRRFVFITQPPD